jgi:hypothetical protein
MSKVPDVEPEPSDRLEDYYRKNDACLCDKASYKFLGIS